MSKSMLTAVLASGVVGFGGLGSAETEKPPELEESENAFYEAGVEIDFNTAYVDRNVVQTDSLVLQPCVWADLTYFEPFWFGFSIWQNYDLNHRRGDIYKTGLNETDYNLHVGATAWSSEDGEHSVGLEFGHDWFTYQGVRGDYAASYPDTRELYLKATYDNPFVNVYGKASWMYTDFGEVESGWCYEIGFNREYEVCDSVTVGADWNVSLADTSYLVYLLGTVKGNVYYEESEDGEAEGPYDDCDRRPRDGFAGTTFKLFARWQITDCLSLGATLAYTGVINGQEREAIGDLGDDYNFNNAEIEGCRGNNYPRDLLWGGINMSLAF